MSRANEEKKDECKEKNMSLERELLSLAKNPTTDRVTELFGPTVEYLTSPDDEHNDFCVLKGTIPPGVSVPLHAHADSEDFLVISGSAEVLQHDAQGDTWITAQAGDFIHVPRNARHAWRNLSSEPVVNLIITTKRLGASSRRRADQRQAQHNRHQRRRSWRDSPP
jgi:quercetin dioxygenase-like cupin family protein